MSNTTIDTAKKYTFVKTYWPPFDASPIEIGSTCHFDKTDSHPWRVTDGDRFKAGFTADRFTELHSLGYLAETD